MGCDALIVRHWCVKHEQTVLVYWNVTATSYLQRWTEPPCVGSRARCLCGPDCVGFAQAMVCERRHAADLRQAGATTVIVNNTEAGTAMGSSLLSGLNVARESQLAYLTTALRKQMEARCCSAQSSELPKCVVCTSDVMAQSNLQHCSHTALVSLLWLFMSAERLWN